MTNEQKTACARKDKKANLLTLASDWYGTVECFPRDGFVVKTSAYNMFLQILDIFTNELSLFSNQLT